MPAPNEDGTERVEELTVEKLPAGAIPVSDALDWAVENGITRAFAFSCMGGNRSRLPAVDPACEMMYFNRKRYVRKNFKTKRVIGIMTKAQAAKKADRKSAPKAAKKAPAKKAPKTTMKKNTAKPKTVVRKKKAAPKAEPTDDGDEFDI